MRLYHSSNMVVEHPDTQHSRKYLDFGRGFYLTTIMNRLSDMHNVSNEEDSPLGLIFMNCWTILSRGISKSLNLMTKNGLISFPNAAMAIMSETMTWLSEELQTTESYLPLTDTLQVNFPKKKLSDC